MRFQSIPKPPSHHDPSFHDEEEAPPVAVRRPGRLNRTRSAQDPCTKAVLNHHAEHIALNHQTLSNYVLKVRVFSFHILKTEVKKVEVCSFGKEMKV